MRGILYVLGTIVVMTGRTSGVAEGQYRGAADPRACVIRDHARFTVLTSALIRMEWSPDGVFEDRPSQVFIHRNLPPPKFEVISEGAWLEIRTDALVLRYNPRSGKFDGDNLSIAFDLNGRRVVWKPGTRDRGNLRGTCRTLDGVSGATALEPGLLSRDGWTLVDDSRRLLFTNDDPPWLTPRPNQDTIDWYFFGYGHDYPRALRDFARVAGPIPLPPRFVFGAWWSRYWAYSDRELRALVGEFDNYDVPLDVLVVDMDWHKKGWTGYTWNPKYFPDPEGFLRWAHSQGLRITLNLHPADGVGKHEAAFKKMATAMEIDPKAVDRIPFDCTDPKYVDAYFRLLHHPMERQGVDFWWIDWQQGEETKIPGLDPLWWLNHLHWQDMKRRAAKTRRRPLIFSRWGGLGNHRYQIGFSGDTYCNWPSLAFQPFFTATAGNVGFAYWSHDIGGHQPGPVEPELFARWVQFGVFSPILRTHTSKNPAAERRIWAFPKDVFGSAKSAYELRYELIPYIYTAARQCTDTAVPLCRPLYYEWPELDEAYQHGGEYLFGDALLVAPVTEPADPISRCAQVKVWLPPGEWTNWFTGQQYHGPREVRLLVPLDETALFVRAGAIIPTMRKMRRSDERPVDPLVLHVWPGESGELQVYEDDGVSMDYQDGRFSRTSVSSKWVDGGLEVALGPTEGSFEGMLTRREYEIRLRDQWPPSEVTIKSDTAAPAAAGSSPPWSYDSATQSIVIHVPRRSVRERIEFRVTPSVELADATPLRSGFRGQLSTLAAIRRILEEAAVMEPTRKAIQSGITATVQSLDTGSGPHPQRRRDVVSIQTVREQLLSDLLQSSEPLSVRREALVRLLGLYRKIRVTADGTNGDRLTAEVEVLPTTALPGSRHLEASVKLQVEGPWRLEGRQQWHRADLTEASPLVATTKLVSEGSLQTGVLRAEIDIQVDGSRIAFQAEHTFLPSINNWWVVGPFDAPFDEALDLKFPPEERIDLDARYKGQAGRPIGWQAVKRTVKPGDDLTDELFVDFDEVFGGRKRDAVAYALAFIEAPCAMDATLALGSDDGVIVWLNDREVHRIDIGRSYASKQDRIPVKLRQGTNTLLLKIKQGGGDWGFGVHIETPSGEPLPEVRTNL